MKPFSAILTVMLAASLLLLTGGQQFPDRKLHSGELFFLPVLQ